MKLTPWLRSLKSGITRVFRKTKAKSRVMNQGGRLLAGGCGGEELEDRIVLDISLYTTQFADGVYDNGHLLQPQPFAPINLPLDPRGIPAIPIRVYFNEDPTIPGLQGGPGTIVQLRGTPGLPSPAAAISLQTYATDPNAPNYPGMQGLAYCFGPDRDANYLEFWYEIRDGENTPGPLQPFPDLHIDNSLRIFYGNTTITDSVGPVILQVPNAGPSSGPASDISFPNSGVILDDFNIFSGQVKHIFIDTQPIVLDIDSTTPDSIPYNIDPSQGTIRRPYRVGDAPIHIQVQLSEPVAITGVPELVLNTNGIAGSQPSDGRGFYVSGSGTSLLNFDYVINPGDNTFDLDVTGSSAFQTPSGSEVRDQDFVQDNGLLAVSGPTNNGTIPGVLGQHRAIQVDTLTPLVGPRPDQPAGSPFVGVTSQNANGTYGAGQTLTLRVSFNEAIVLTGAPTLVLATGPVNREATFAGFDGTDTLLFTYTVQPGDLSNDLSYVGPNSLKLNGGSLTDLAGNIADLTLPAPGAVGSLNFNKDIIIDTIVAVTNVTTTVPSGSYGIGQVIPITVTFNKAVTVFGLPQLTLDLDSPADSVIVDYSTGSGTKTLTFNYTILAGHNTLDLDYISASALQLNGGAIVDTIGNGNAVLTLPLPGAQGSLGFNKNILIDTNLPLIATVSAGASVPNGTYVAGQTIPITVTFNEPVSVTGTPQITLDTNGLPGAQPFLNPGDTADAIVNYTSGSGTTTLTFNYTIAQGQNSPDLDGLFLTLANNSQIRDIAGNQIAPTGSILSMPQFPNEPLTNANIVKNVAPVAQIDDITVGNVQVGATYQFTVSGFTFSYQANANDTQATIATSLRQQVFGPVSASGFGNVVRLTATTPGTPFTVTIPVSSPLTVTGTNPTTNPHVRNNVAAVAQVDTITVTSVSQGTVYDYVINGIGAPLSYTATVNDTASTVALQIRNKINGFVSLAAQVTATSNGPTVTITSNVAGTPVILSTGHSLAGNRNLVIDTAPVVTNVSDTTDADGTYSAPTTLTLDVRFTEAVDVIGTPTLVLETNGIPGIQLGSDAEAMYQSGTGTNTLQFLYTIGSGQSSVDLNYASTLALLLNGGSIRDRDGTAANFDPNLPGLNTTGALILNNDIQIDDIVQNDPPVNFIPGLQTIVEDVLGGRVFSTANNNLISIKDVDVGPNDIQVTLTAAHGIVTVPVTTGLTSITNNGTASVVIVGSLATVNARLDGLIFTPDANVNSASTTGIQLTIATDDLGNTGAGGNQTDSDIILFNVTAVNDVPVAANQTVQTAVGTAIVINLQATDADFDSLAYVLDPSTQPAHGTLTQVAGSNQVTYTPNAGYVGPDIFRFTAQDSSSTSNFGLVTINVVPVVSLTGFPDILVNEGNVGITNATFTINLSQPAPFPVTINFATVPGSGTATANVDYQTTSNQVTFAVGEQSKTFTVPILGDLVDEPGETFNVVLSGPTNVVLLDTTATATIQNDDGLSINDSTAVEDNSGSKTFTFNVHLSSPSASTVTVNYQTVDGSASQNSDYNNQNGILSFIPGQQDKTISITVNGDVINESDETFFVNLFSPVGASLGKSQGLGTILNDDSVPTASIGDVSIVEGNSGTKVMTFLVSLSSISGQTVTMNYATVDATALAGNDYFATSGTVTFNPGQTTQQISVQIIGDQVVEPDDSFFVNLTNAVNVSLSDSQAVGTISNDDGVLISNAQIVEGNSGTKNLVFTVTAPLTGGQTVSVDYSTSPGTATPGADYTPVSGTLLFTGGSTSKTISVPIVGDFLQEADETFFLNLSNAVNAPLLDDQAVGTIQDDDLTPTISTGDVSIVEGNSGTKNAVFTLTLSQAIGVTVTVDYSTFDISTTAGADYVPVSGTVTFQPFSTTATINVPILGDILDEGSETLRLHLSNATNASLFNTDPIATILDDDATPTLSINDLSLNEGQAGQTQATFTVSLSAPSGQTVTVDFLTANGSATSVNNPNNNSSNDFVAQGATLTFAPGVTSQPITITINGDALFELDETFAINLTNAVNAGITDNQAVGTIVNDDAKPTVTISDATVFEGNSGTTQMTFTLSLQQPSALPATVNYSSSSGTATDGNDYQTASGSVTFAPGETSKTITINVIGDGNVETDENFFINLAGAVNSVVGDAVGVGTIRNDDVLPSLVVNDATLVEGDSGTSQMVFTVTRINANSQNTTVQYSTSNGTATAGQDYNLTQGTLTFLPNETTKTISIPITGNTTAEPDETFFLNLSNPTNASIQDGQGLGTIENDDNAPPAVTVPLGTLSATEDTNVVVTGISISDPDAGLATINVTLTAHHGTIVIANNVGGGLTGSQILNNGTNSVQLVGSITAINTTLASANGVTYRGFTDFFGTETLFVTANDLGNSGNSNTPLSDTKAVTIVVSDVNDEPEISFTGAGPGGAPTAVTSIKGNAIAAFGAPNTLTLTDSDNLNFAGGTLTVTNLGPFISAKDKVSVRNQGSASGLIGLLKKGDITYGGQVIGHLSGGVGNNPLVITLNNKASVAAVTALMKNITFGTAKGHLTTLPRTISMVLTDGRGGTSNTIQSTVNVNK